MSRPAIPRYSWADFDIWLRVNYPFVGKKPQDEGPTNPIRLHELLGWDPNKLFRSRRAGWVSTWRADEIATHLKVHPSRIWPSWFDDAEREPRCAVCGDPVPYFYADRLNETCSKTCRKYLWTMRHQAVA